MAKVSRTTAENVQDFGVAEDRSTTADGYTMAFTTIREAHDLAPALAGLPGGHCSCPALGLRHAGRLVFTSATTTRCTKPATPSTRRPATRPRPTPTPSS